MDTKYIQQMSRATRRAPKLVHIIDYSASNIYYSHIHEKVVFRATKFYSFGNFSHIHGFIFANTFGLDGVD